MPLCAPPNFQMFSRKLVNLKLEKGLSFGDVLLDGTLQFGDEKSKEPSKEVLSSTIFNHVSRFSFPKSYKMNSC